MNRFVDIVVWTMTCAVLVAVIWATAIITYGLLA